MLKKIYEMNSGSRMYRTATASIQHQQQQLGLRRYAHMAPTDINNSRSTLAYTLARRRQRISTIAINWLEGDNTQSIGWRHQRPLVPSPYMAKTLGKIETIRNQLEEYLWSTWPWDEVRWTVLRQSGGGTSKNTRDHDRKACNHNHGLRAIRATSPMPTEDGPGIYTNTSPLFAKLIKLQSPYAKPLDR